MSQKPNFKHVKTSELLSHLNLFIVSDTGSVLLCFLLLKKHWSEATWRGKGSFALHNHITTHHWGKSKQELRQLPGGRHWCRDHKGVSHGLFSLFSYIAQAYVLEDGSSHLNHESRKMPPQKWSHVNLMEEILQLKFSLPKWLLIGSSWQKLTTEARLSVSLSWQHGHILAASPSTTCMGCYREHFFLNNLISSLKH